MIQKDNKILEYYTLRYGFLNMKGYIDIFHFIAWFYAFCIILLIQFKVLDNMVNRFEIIMISYEIIYPLFIICMLYNQTLKHFSIFPLFWIPITCLNLYFNYIFLNILYNCNDNQLCKADKSIYMWFCGLFVTLIILDAIILLLFSRIFVHIMSFSKYTNKYKSISDEIDKIIKRVSQELNHNTYNNITKKKFANDTKLRISVDHYAIKNINFDLNLNK